MNEVTLCFPLANRESPIVLLGLKKRGFGQGKYVGFGGKIEAGETVEEAAVRELEEETGLQATVEDLEPAGRLMFLFPARPEWDHLVHVYQLRHWQGKPQESAEMRPQWFAVDAIPYAADVGRCPVVAADCSIGPGHPRRLLVQRRSCHGGRDGTHSRGIGSVKTRNLSAYTQETQASVDDTYLMPV